MCEPMSSLSDWDKVEKESQEMIADAAKGSDSEVLKDIAKKKDPKRRHEIDVNDRVIRQIINECMDSYREGDYTFKETVKGICEALEALV